MKPGDPIPPEVFRIDDQIREIHWRIRATEEEIVRMMKTNDGRRESLRALGRRRSELMTYDLF